jgi:hypothetical protein
MIMKGSKGMNGREQSSGARDAPCGILPKVSFEVFAQRA